MGRKTTLGLYKRGNTWHIDKRIKGYGRLCESTDETSLQKAEAYLEQRIRKIKEAKSTRPKVKWRTAAAYYLEEYPDKANILTESGYLERLDPFIGDLYLEQVHDSTLKKYVSWRKSQGRKTKTINHALGLVRHILNLCADSWRHNDSGLTWLEKAPRIMMQKPPKGLDDSRRPYPLDWDEQDRLFKLLPAHLAKMALYKVNTGCREDEVCGLRWEWELKTEFEEFDGRIFILPGNVELLGGTSVKNREDRLVICNDVSKSVIDSCRGDHPEYVFTYRGRPVKRMNNTGWINAWRKAGLPVNDTYKRGVHNLKHTCGRRLRSAGVPFETRQVLLGHTNGSITTHYSQAEIEELLNAVQKICIGKNSRKTPALVLLKVNAQGMAVA
jgi:integrase